MTKFKSWLENWHHFGNTVTLFHGTSSAFLSDIKTNGIQLPGENLETYARKLIGKIYLTLPTEYVEKVFNSINSLRQSDLHNLGNVIYLATSYEDAKGYADSYYELGGEIAYDVYFWIASYCKENNQPVPPKPLAGSKPVVIEVEIPFDWMMTFYDLPKRLTNLKKHWDDYDHQNYKSFDDYLKVQGGFEVRVSKPIPPQMIKSIHA